MEIDYTNITPEMEEYYGLNNIPVRATLPDEDTFISDSMRENHLDNVELVSYELNKRKTTRTIYAKYYEYKNKLTVEEDPKRNKDNFLLVRCKFCRKYYIPSKSSVVNRVSALNGVYSTGTENNLYCSSSCKNNCPTYNSSGSVNNTRDISYSQQAREIALELANNECEVCGSKGNLEVHHIKPFKTNPLEAYDIDNLVVYCHSCHMEKGHSDRECTTGYLAKCK